MDGTFGSSTVFSFPFKFSSQLCIKTIKHIATKQINLKRIFYGLTSLISLTITFSITLHSNKRNESLQICLWSYIIHFYDGLYECAIILLTGSENQFLNYESDLQLFF